MVSTGERIANPRHLERKARNLKRYRRRMARTTPGSANRNTAKKKAAAAHRKVRHARTDSLHRTTTRLVREHDVIAIEDLNVRAIGTSTRRRTSVRLVESQPGRDPRARPGEPM
ncbi:hypothetical protein GCM10023405_22100 [Streptomonospora salina]